MKRMVWLGLALLAACNSDGCGMALGEDSIQACAKACAGGIKRVTASLCECQPLQRSPQ